ncbi:MAG TPA: hypothetical protein VE569_11915 [Acidimicrobiia bacterium]|nr:hypothetical protein [Acidimicrobiia bacterium]
MTRPLLIGGAVAVLVGPSAYFGMGQTWGAPVAVTGVGSAAIGFGLLASDTVGPTRWAGSAAAVSGLVLVVILIGTSISGEPAVSLVNTAFVSFMTSLALFGIVGLVSGTIPAIAATSLAVGAPLLAAGVWNERLGDIGFLATFSGLMVLGVALREGIGT